MQTNMLEKGTKEQIQEWLFIGVPMTNDIAKLLSTVSIWAESFLKSSSLFYKDRGNVAYNLPSTDPTSIGRGWFFTNES